jgi:rfaE bifunctional protein nucleotidyltransferase chain/domain
MIIAHSDLGALRLSCRDKQIAFTSGSFDIIHVGHLELLRWCKRQGDITVVALNSDEIIRQKKGSARPVTPINQRLAILDELRSVDYVLPVDGDDASTLPWLKTAEALNPDICVLGPDWAYKEIDKWVARVNTARILVAPERIGPSTTLIIDRIQQV